MTEQIKEQTPEQVQEAQTKARAEEEAAFLAGATETPEKAVEEPKQAKTETKADPKPKEKAEPEKKAAPAKAAVDEWEGVQPAVRKALENISSKIANTENLAKAAVGRVSAVQSALDAAKAAAKSGADAPTKEEIAAAADTTEKWKKLKDDFPEWAEAMDERFAAERSANEKKPALDVDALKKDVTGGVQQAINQGLDVAEERAFLRMKYPDWKQTVKSPEFTAWLNAQPEDTQKLADSPMADDAITMLGAFAEHQRVAKEVAAAAAEQKTKQNKERLEQAVQPQGSTRGQPRSETEEDAFVQGFQHALGG